MNKRATLTPLTPTGTGFQMYILDYLEEAVSKPDPREEFRKACRETRRIQVLERAEKKKQGGLTKEKSVVE